MASKRKGPSKKVLDARRKLVLQALDELSSKLHLTGWKFRIAFPEKASIEKDDSTGKVVACISSLGMYKDASIEFVLAEIEDDEVRGVVLHELIHCLTTPLKDKAFTRIKNKEARQALSDLEETLVTHIERVLLEAGI